ncbi:MAG: EB domain-containing protein [Candidatus ainarchaeum sp.]|nr:EB domain-containing protein [Candidatus ainarchaeum sp.]
MKKILLLLFCLIFIASVGFSETVLSGVLNSKLDLVSGGVYTVEGDMYIRAAGQFSMAANQIGVEFRCLPGITIHVESDFTGNYLFDIKGANFHIDNCVIDFGLDNKTAFYYDTASKANITNTTINNASVAIRLHKIADVSTISNLFLENVTTGIYATSRFSDQIRANITTNGLRGSNVDYYFNFSGNVIYQTGLFLNITDLSVTDFTKMGFTSINTPTYTINIDQINSTSLIDLTGSLFKELDLANSSINQLKVTNNSVTDSVKIDISDTIIDSCGDYCIYLDAKVFPLTLTNVYFDSGDYGVKTGSTNTKEIYFLSTNSIYSEIDNALSFRQKTMTFQSTGDNYGGGNVILENISTPENVAINSATGLGNLTVVNSGGALAVINSEFSPEKGLLLSTCNASSLIGLNNVIFSTDQEIKDFVEGFFSDDSCYPYLLSAGNTKINTDKFWSFNKSAGSDNPDVTGVITDADAPDFSAILAYDYPLSITGVTAGYARFDSSSDEDEFSLEGVSFIDLYNNSTNLTILRSEIETIELIDTEGIIKANTIGHLSLDGLSDGLKISNNEIYYPLECDSLSNTSDVSYYDAKDLTAKNIKGVNGTGGNWWAGFSDSSTKCKNEIDDAFCDAKYTFTCNGKTYDDLYPLTLLGPTVVVDEDNENNDSSSNSSSNSNSCTKNSDCLGTESCISGQCKDLNCKVGQVISNYACVDCLTDAQCPADSKCSLNKCEKVTCKADEKVESHKCVKLSGNAGLGTGTDKDIDVDAGVDKDVDSDVNAPGGQIEEPGFFQKLSDWIKGHALVLGIVGGIVVLLIIILIVVLVVLHNKKKKALLGEEEPKEESVEAEPEEKEPKEEKEPQKEEEEPKAEGEDKSPEDEDSDNLDTSGWSK